MSLPRDAGSIAIARRTVRDALLDRSDAKVCRDALLGVSELVTNVVRHGSTEVLTLTIDVDPERGVARIAVRADASAPTADDWDDPDDQYSLQIVDAISDRHGVDPTGTGEEMWFEVTIDRAGRT